MCVTPASSDGDGVGDAQADVVVRVNAEPAFEVRAREARQLEDLRGQRPAVGVAERDDIRARAHGGLPRGQRVLAIVLGAVKRVLGVVHHELAVCLQMRDRVGDHREILLGRRLQHFADVQEPGFAEDGDDGRGGVEQEAHLIVPARLDVFPARGAEGRERARGGTCDASPARRTRCPWVRAGPAALDVVHAERVEPLGDPQLVGDRERDALALRAVAQGRVVDFDDVGARGHGQASIVPP